MRKYSVPAALALYIIAAPALHAQAGAGDPGATNATTTNNDDDFPIGLVGLLGLAGLLGLRRRENRGDARR